MTVTTPTVEIAPGVHMPVVGLGTAGLLDRSGYAAVRDALDAGYRHLDTATAYRNEAEIGRAVHDSGLDRSGVFVTTKLPPEQAGRETDVLEASLRALGLDHVDLWLVHWPPRGSAAVSSWETFVAARESGKVRAVGVSNYDLAQIDELIAATGVAPAVNQVPWSPPRHNPATLAAHRDRGVMVEGYSPLRGTDLRARTLNTIADHDGVAPAQVVLCGGICSTGSSSSRSPATPGACAPTLTCGDSFSPRTRWQLSMHWRRHSLHGRAG